jgi:hypothetical protein
VYERGLILWIRERSEYCHDLNFNSGGGGCTPNGVGKCGGSAWFTVYRRPDGGGCPGGVGASRGAEQADPQGSGRRAGCNCRAGCNRSRVARSSKGIVSSFLAIKHKCDWNNKT